MTSKHEIAHLGHVALLTPEPEKSLRFLTRVMGLTEVGTEGDSVYLRTWDDYEHHTRKLTAHSTSGAKGQAWGLKTIESFHTHGTPPV